MARPVFNRDLFKAKRAESEKFSKPDKGTYVTVLRKASSGYTKETNKLMVSFGYQIEEAGNPFNNQYIWSRTILTDEHGNSQEKGYEALAVQMSILKIEARQDENLDLELESAIGSKCRIDYDPDDNGYEKLRIKKLISRPDGTEPVSGYKNNSEIQADELDAEIDSNRVEAVAGMTLILDTGQRMILVKELETTETADGTEKLMVYPENGKQTDIVMIDKSSVVDFEMPKNKVVEEKPSTTPVTSPNSGITTSTTIVNHPTPTADELDKNESPLQEELVEEELLEEESDAPDLTIKPDNPAIIGKKASGTSTKSGKGVVGVIFENKTPDGMILITDGKMAYRCKPETVALVA